MRFVLFKGQGQYGSLRLHTDQLGAALVSLGYDVRICDLVSSDAQLQLDAAIADRADCYFGISGCGSDLKATDGRSIFDALGAAYASLYVDHPLHHLERLQSPITRNFAFFLDRSHVQFMTAWPPGRTFSHLGFLPPGANELPDPPEVSDEAFARRDLSVLFTGTYRGEPQTPWRSWADRPTQLVVEAIADRMTADARLPVLDAFRATLKHRNVEYTPKLLADFGPILQVVQSFAEAYHRDVLLHALGKADVPLTVYGKGWEPLAAQYPAWTFGGEGSFAETLHLVRRARVVLNTSNGFVAGGHERVFTAMCGGAAVFSDETRYLAEAFKEGREIVTFAWPKVADAPAKLQALLADEARLAAIARAGAARAMAEHRWSDRPHRIVKAVKQAG